MASNSGSDSGDLALQVRREADGMVLEARGEVTVFTSPALRQELRKIALERPRVLIIDLAGTVYVDSSGVATLVEGLQLVQKYGGKLVLAGMNDRVRGVFEIARLDSVFQIAGSVEEALKK